MKRLLVSSSALIFAFACGGGGSSTPTAPSVTAPVISTPNTSVYVGQSVTFTATGGGTIRWGGDAPGVATVDQTTGRVTGVGSGNVTIWAENAGGRTTRLLRSMSSFAGNWQGNYVLQGCTQNGIFAALDSCKDQPGGKSLSMALVLTQTEDRVAGGSIAFGGLTGTTTPSSVGGDDQIRLTAAIDPLAGNPIRLAVENMVLNSPSPGNIQGSLEQVYSTTLASGTMRVFTRVANLTRTSGGPSLRPRAPRNATTLDDLLRLMNE